jgi:spore coat assembly protein
VLIHALDPVYIASKVSYTSVSDIVNMFDVIDHTVSGLKGLGGVETKGSYRIGIPKLKL